MDHIADAASMLAASRLAGLPVDVLPVPMRPRDEAEGYWVQGAVHDMIARSRFGPIAGYKVGCTSPVMQKYLGMKKPCWGGVFAGTMHHSGVKIRHDSFQRVGMDCQIALRLRRDLPASQGPYDASNVADAVECYMAAIELVDDRYVDWRKTDIPTLIADDFFAAATVLGEPVPAVDVGNPSELIGIATINGADVGRGRGSDVMGHPLNVLAWLANAMIGRGDWLTAGEIVLLGGMFQTRWLSENDAAAFDVSRLGRVEVSVV